MVSNIILAHMLVPAGVRHEKNRTVAVGHQRGTNHKTATRNAIIRSVFVTSGIFISENSLLSIVWRRPIGGRRVPVPF